MKRIIYIILGSIMVAIGAVGIVLPGLPTTIFLIIAAYFYTHSSPSLYNKLMNNKRFGPLITNFTKYRGITYNDRIKALITIWIVFGISLFLSQNMIFGLIILSVGIIHTVFIFRLNVLTN